MNAFIKNKGQSEIAALLRIFIIMMCASEGHAMYDDPRETCLPLPFDARTTPRRSAIWRRTAKGGPARPPRSRRRRRRREDDITEPIHFFSEAANPSKGPGLDRIYADIQAVPSANKVKGLRAVQMLIIKILLKKDLNLSLHRKVFPTLGIVDRLSKEKPT